MNSKPFDLSELVEGYPEAKAELAALREQLRLANIDAVNNEAEANALRAAKKEEYQRRIIAREQVVALRAERDRLRAALLNLVVAVDKLDFTACGLTAQTQDARAALKEE